MHITPGGALHAVLDGWPKSWNMGRPTGDPDGLPCLARCPDRAGPAPNVGVHPRPHPRLTGHTPDGADPGCRPQLVEGAHHRVGGRLVGGRDVEDDESRLVQVLLLDAHAPDDEQP